MVLHKNNGHKKNTTKCLENLWDQYLSQNKPKELRNKLIEEYSSLVNLVVSRFLYFGHPDFDKEDLKGYGLIGLMDAIKRYNPKLNSSFEAFALHRIKGEILDFFRSIDLLKRSSREKVKNYNHVLIQLASELGRKPTDKEIQAALKIDEKSHRELQQEASALVLSYDILNSGSLLDDNERFNEFLAEDAKQEEITDSHLMTEKFLEVFQHLPSREQIVVTLHDLYNYTYKEIGNKVHLSESRANQLHSSAVRKLKAMMHGFDI